ncbi:MAG: helix-turn-helix transcriptional regulator [Clostridia bacterium]|nr:helix-turn-helix transcriptional regulator [Clostridia bacterium]
MNELCLKELRLKRGLSQEYIAEKVYVVRQTVSKWEKGLSSPSWEQLKSLCTLLDVSPDLLLGMKNGFASEPPVNSGLSEQAQPSQGVCSAVNKKEEMITSITALLEGMNETGVTFWNDFIMSIPVKERWLASTSQERIDELDAIAALREHEAAQEKEKTAMEARQLADAKRERCFHDYARMFNAIKTVDVPIRYDLSIGEIQAIDFICGEVSRFFPEYAYSVACKYFKYGFVKGTRYAKRKKKKTRQTDERCYAE